MYAERLERPLGVEKFSYRPKDLHSVLSRRELEQTKEVLSRSRTVVKREAMVRCSKHQKRHRVTQGERLLKARRQSLGYVCP